MELLKTLFQIISKVVPAPSLSGKNMKELAKLNTEKFYVENLRLILGISSDAARRICETAVRQGLFTRGVEVRCPDGSIAITADSEDHLPEEIRCWKNIDGFLEPEMLQTKILEKSTFYRLNDRPERLPVGRTA